MKKRKIEVPLQNGKELKPIMIKPNMGKIIKPMMERDPFPKREQKRIIKLTPAQRKKERGEKAHFGIHVANVAALRGLGGGLRGAKAVSRSRNVTANPFKSADAQLLEKYPTGSQLHKFHKDQAKHFAKQFKKPMAKFPDLSGDGKVTQKDILIGKGVIDKPKYYGDKPKMYGKKPKMYNKPKNKVKKDTPERLKIKKTGRELQNALIKEKSKPVTQQDKRVINQLQGAIEEQKKKLKNPTMKKPKMYKKPKASYNMLSGLGTKKGQRKVKRAAKATARAKKNIDMVKISQTGKITKSGTVSSAKNQSRQGVALRQQKKATRLMGQALKKSTPSRRKAKRQAVKATKAEYVGGRKLGQVTKKTAVSLTKAKYEKKK